MNISDERRVLDLLSDLVSGKYDSMWHIKSIRWNILDDPIEKEIEIAYDLNWYNLSRERVNNNSQVTVEFL